MEISDEMVKRKHKEFNKRIKVALTNMSGQTGEEPISLADKIRQALSRSSRLQIGR